jgi:hypothetical protein
MQVIHFDQEVQVCEILNLFNFELLFVWLSFFAFILEIWAILLFVFSSLLAWSFFSNALYHGFFLDSSYFFSVKKDLLKRVMTCGWSIYLIGGRIACFCVTLSVRVSILFLECTWILIMSAWRESHMGHNNLTKLNVIASSIWLRFLQWKMSYGSGRIYHHWGTFHFSFF